MISQDREQKDDDRLLLNEMNDLGGGSVFP